MERRIPGVAGRRGRGAALALAGGLAVAGAPALEALGAPPVMIVRMVAKGQVRVAHREVQDLLVRNPDDADLHATLGAALSAASFYPDALVAFSFAAGSAWYEKRGAGYHADALAQVGRGAEAAELRAELLAVSGARERNEVGIRVRMVDDHLVGGDLDAALELAEALVADHGDYLLPWAVLAEVHLARGDRDEVEWALLQGRRLGQPDQLRLAVVETRLLLDDGQAEAAFQRIELMRRAHFRELDMWALRMDTLTAAGAAEEALSIAGMERFGFQDHPAFTAATARALAATGDRAAAEALLAGALAAHPGNRALQGALRGAPEAAGGQ